MSTYDIVGVGHTDTKTLTFCSVLHSFILYWKVIEVATSNLKGFYLELFFAILLVTNSIFRIYFR